MQNVAIMIQRALNLVDRRLIDHGLRVANMLDAMLEVSGLCPIKQRRAMYLVALLHDVGAYRTEDIDQLVKFETGDVLRHSIYGYQFFKELSPLDSYAEIVLYHHTPSSQLEGKDPTLRFFAEALFVADRMDVFFIQQPDASFEEAVAAIESMCPTHASLEAVSLLKEAESRFTWLGLLGAGAQRESPLATPVDDLEVNKAVTCLDMLVHVIDFRSRHTVAHTVTTARVAYGIARRMLRDEDEAGRVYFSALLHDLGKIGIPLSILEKPGRLTDEEMDEMRTHVVLTEDIIEGCVDEELVRMAVRHHEKFDGSGYPRGLHADDLTLPERIIVVADIVSALVGTRSYKDAFPKEKVLFLLCEQRDKGLVDASVVNEVVRDYDEIIEEAARASKPVSAAYRRVEAGYDQMAKAMIEPHGKGEEQV